MNKIPFHVDAGEFAVLKDAVNELLDSLFTVKDVDEDYSDRVERLLRRLEKLEQNVILPH